ncbi:MAG: xanthine dehydrogenase family protein subunit M [Spirochaetota bacterium]
MKSGNDFIYHRPASLFEAVNLLAADPSLRPLAGGTDLIPQMEERSLSPGGVVDVKAIPELNALDFNEQAGLKIGAAVALSRLLQFTPLLEHYRLLAEALKLIGCEQVRARGTIGGNLCNASPSADTAPPLLCLEAGTVIAGPDGERKIPLDHFFLGPGCTVLRPGEIMVAVLVPPPIADSGAAYFRHTARAEMDIAVASAAALISLAKDGRTIRKARLALGAVAPKPFTVKEVERILASGELNDSSMLKAAKCAREAARPIDDVRGSAWFRLELVEGLTKRALQTARERAAQCTQRR